MATIQSSIRLYDDFSGPMQQIIQAAGTGIDTMERLRTQLNRPVDTGSMNAVQAQIDEVTEAAQRLNAALGVSPSVSMEQPKADIQPVEVPITPIITEQPQIETPDEINIPVTPIVTEQPVIDIPVSVEPPDMDMSGLQSQIEAVSSMLGKVVSIQDNISARANNIFVLPDDTKDKISAVNAKIQEMNAALAYLQNNPFDLSTEAVRLQIVELNNSILEAANAQKELNAELEGLSVPELPQPPPVEVPIEWKSDNLEVFNNTGIERFQSEVQSVNRMLNTLNETQGRITNAAANTKLFPPNMVSDMNGVQSRLQAIQNRIVQIEKNPLEMGTDAANNELEQLRAQLSQAISAQQEMNAAVENMDVAGANEAYLKLSNTISGAERKIRDEISEQGKFTQEIQNSADKAASLEGIIGKVVAAFGGLTIIRKAAEFAKEATEAFDTQRNAEVQLMSVLSNMADWGEVPEFIVGIDDSLALDQFGELISIIDGTKVDVTADMRTDYLMKQFDAVRDKASEIQKSGIYSDEAMIAAGAEFATYFSDTDAITTMMDTLSNYAMGMSGGGEVDASSMVDYATGLGKIMTGSYDAMTRKGFEFTDAQKAIIEGTATEAQYLDVLGEGWADMSEEMRAAAAISSVINESWGGLYETMSNTPEGQIIQLTNAWGDMKEMVGEGLYPSILLVVEAINAHGPEIEQIVGGVTNVLSFCIQVVSMLIDKVFAAYNAFQQWQGSMAILNAVKSGIMLIVNAFQIAGQIASAVAGFIVNNWSWIAPVIMGIVAAILIYNAVTTVAGAISAAWGAVTAVAAAIANSPLLLTVLIITALIAAITAATRYVNAFGSQGRSTFGTICGWINVTIDFFKNLGLLVANIALGIWEAMKAAATNMGIAFHNSINSIQGWFWDMLSTAMTVIAGIAAELNALPFIEFDYSGIVAKADEYAARSAEAYGNVEDYVSISDAFAEGYDTYSTFQSGWAQDAFDAGADWGDGVTETVEDFFSGLTTDFDSYFGELEEIPDMGDFAMELAATPTISGIAADVGNIAGGVGDIADALDVTDEDLKYLRDIAEQEVVNRFTTAEIVIDMSGMQNTVNNELDLDGVIDYLTDGVTEAIEVVSEGVHA